MPRHLICDAHEWINDATTVPVYCKAKPQPSERGRPILRGKKTLLSLTLDFLPPNFIYIVVAGSFTLWAFMKDRRYVVLVAYDMNVFRIPFRCASCELKFSKNRTTRPNTKSWGVWLGRHTSKTITEVTKD